jgi:hypothetical protein
MTDFYNLVEIRDREIGEIGSPIVPYTPYEKREDCLRIFF